MTRHRASTVAEFVPAARYGWSRTRLKALLYEIDVRDASYDIELLGISKSRGVLRRSDIEQRASQALDYSSYKQVWPGDLISNKMQAWNGVFGISPWRGKASPDYAVYRFKDGVQPRFIEYIVRTPLYAAEFLARSRGMGTGFMRLNADAFLDTEVWVPGRDTQKAITDFLDRETARIDQLIEKKQRFSEIQNERRFAEISHLLTKGLHADAERRSSGVDWIK